MEEDLSTYLWRKHPALAKAMENPPRAISELNELARMGASRVSATEVISQLNTVQDILMSPLPIMMEPLNFDDRYDLFFYLRLLDLENRETKTAPFDDEADRNKKFVQIRDKVTEISQRLELPDNAFETMWTDRNAGVINDEAKSPQRPGINGLRDLDAAAWIKETKPNLEEMTNPQIENALKARDGKREVKLWSNGFTDWNRNQQVWPKRKSGRKPKQVML